MQVHITSPSYLKIDPGFPSLRMLKLPPNPVQTSGLEQTRPGLVKAKGNIVFRTLIGAKSMGPISGAQTIIL